MLTSENGSNTTPVTCTTPLSDAAAKTGRGHGRSVLQGAPAAVSHMQVDPDCQEKVRMWLKSGCVLAYHKQAKCNFVAGRCQRMPRPAYRITPRKVKRRHKSDMNLCTSTCAGMHQGTHMLVICYSPLYAAPVLPDSYDTAKLWL